MLKKSYTSDDELDELDSPITSIIIENSQDSPTSKAPNWKRMGEGGQKVVRYQLLQEIWKDGDLVSSDPPPSCLNMFLYVCT